MQITDNNINILLKKLKNLGIHVSVDKNELSVKAPKGSMSQDLLKELKEKKADLLAYLIYARTESSEIEAVSIAENYELSSAQHRLWVLSQFEEGSIAYNMAFRIELRKTYNIENFQKAIRAVIERHESLRTIFKTEENGAVKQWVLSAKELNFELDYQDFQTVEDQQGQVEEYIANDSFKAFDLENGPLLRASLFQFSAAHYVFYFNMHHIISDGWSMKVLTKDVMAFYEAFEKNETPRLAPLDIQYKDYAAWQREQLSGAEYEVHKNYWLNQFEGELPHIDLPSSKVRPALQTYNGRNLSTYLSKETTTALKNYSQQEGGSLFMGLLASWNVLFSRYLDATDVIIGTPIAGREHLDLENQIGFYVNTLALRNHVDQSASFIDHLKSVKKNTLSAYSHQMYPFDHLVEDLDLQRDTSRNALFDVMLTLQNIGDNSNGNALGYAANAIKDNGPVSAKFDLNISGVESGEQLQLFLTFNADIYSVEMIEGLLLHYKSLLTELLNQPTAPLATLDYLSAPEKLELVETFNATTCDYPKAKSVVDLFAAQVKETPDAIAVVFANHRLTYADLQAQSNQFAHFLLSKTNIATEDFISIKLERSEWLMVTILGVLKTGAAYVPIDTTYPADRIAFIEQDTNCKLRIDAALLDEFTANKETFSTQSIENEISAKNLAYVMYTSGSTGTPKGVMVEHQNIVRLVKSANFYQCTPSDTLLSTGAFSFDATTFEYWGMLLNGGRLVLTDQDTLLKPELLSAEIKRQAVNVMWFTAGWFNQLIESNGDLFQDLKTVLVGGDKLSPNQIADLKTSCPDIQIINGYGPTENTTFSLTYDIKNVDGDIPIGSPISNSQAYILDAQLNLCPIGVAGEICLSGDGLSRGYLNQEELTNEKFVSNPFNPATRLYKTGDLGKWTADGIIEFIGRKDDQVKIRGFRIELGEIEHALLSQAAIDDAVVIVVETETDKELVAYLTSKAAQTSASLRESLKAVLPAYMIPNHFVQLDAFPLNSNGKVDKRALPSPQELGLSSGVEYIAPSNETEEKLVAIWENILQKEQIGIKDDFFALGGHSLKATRLISEYHKAFHVKLSLKDLFIRTSLASHAALIKGADEKTFTAIPKLAEQESYVISDAQRRLWVLSQFEEGSVAYNIPYHTELTAAYNIENFQKAIHAVITRHEILRTVFKIDENGDIRQWILSPNEFNFELDYQDYQLIEDKQKQVKKYINADSYTAFDLKNGPLLRAALLQLSANRYVFYFNMHHIISDGWSMELLTKDTLAFYEAFEQNTAAALPNLAIQYKDYAAWQQNQLSATEYEAHKTYWLNQFKGEIPRIDLPSKKLRPVRQSYKGHAFSTYLSKESSVALKNFSQQEGGSLFMGLLASFNVLFSRYTGANDITIGTPIAGREHLDLENQIGCYLNTLPLRNKVDQSASFTKHFKAVKENTLNAYSHQIYPFDRLVEDLNLKRDTSRNALFDVMFTFQNHLDLGNNSAEKDAEKVTDKGSVSAKFDLNIIGIEAGAQIEIYLTFNTDIYASEMAEGLLIHYKALLSELLRQPDAAISSLNYLSASEKKQLIEDFNPTPVDYPKDKSVIDLFATQVIETPNKTALVFKENELTYQELDILSSQLAACLDSNHNIGINAVVGIELDKSEWQLVSILAILKCGAVYVPIATEYPVARKQYIAEAAKLDLLITDTSIMFDIDYFLGDLFAIDVSFAAEEHASDYVQKVNPDAPAYIMFTSGSTGKPKGVVISHRNITSLVKNTNFIDFGEDHRLLSTGAFSFDATTFEYWGMLLNGGELILCDQSVLLDDKLLEQEIKEREIDLMWFTSGWLNQLVDNNISLFESLKTIIVGGDRLSQIHIRALRLSHPDLKVISAYGPTENTTFTTTYPINEVDGDIPLGKPLNNRQAYVLDNELNLCSIGVIGEICLSGDGLSSGYLNQEEETNDKFVPNPFKSGTRIYKTGDLGKWNADGVLEFIGRKDDQIKIRGYRIGLGEIELALQEQEGIEEAVVIALATAEDKELVAYLTSKETQSAAVLSESLRKLLPAYMIPGRFVQLESFPLNSNGKVDKKALPSPELLDLSSGIEYIAPRNKIEEKLVAIWERVLQKEPIGIKDDFFNLGGHSMKATRLASIIKREFNIKLSIGDLIGNPQLKVQAQLIQNAKEEIFEEIKNIPIANKYPVTDTQKRFWLLSQTDEGNIAYQVHSKIRFEGINYDAFQKAVRVVMEKHEILRTVFKYDVESENLFQKVLSLDELNFNILTTDFSKSQNKEKQLEENWKEQILVPFDLSNGPLIRIAVFTLGNGIYEIQYAIHHIISDGWSMELLMKEIADNYQILCNGETPEIEKLPIQFKEYAVWINNQIESGKLNEARDYFAGLLKSEIPRVQYQNFDIPSSGSDGEEMTFLLSDKTYEKWNEICAQNKGTSYVTLIALVGILLNKWIDQEELIIGSSFSGRQHASLENQLGPYLNTLPVVLNVDKEMPFDQYYKQVNQTFYKMLNYQSYPLGEIIEGLNNAGKGVSELFNVLIEYHSGYGFTEKRKIIKDEQQADGPLTLKPKIVQFDLGIELFEMEDGLILLFNYKKAFIKRDLVEVLKIRFENLINQIDNYLEIKEMDPDLENVLDKMMEKEEGF